MATEACELCGKKTDYLAEHPISKKIVCDDCLGGKPQDNSIEHPPHYTFGKYEVFYVLMDWFKNDPLLWQVGKYISRAHHKGKYESDLKKAKWYLDKAIERGEN